MRAVQHGPQSSVWHQFHLLSGEDIHIYKSDLMLDRHLCNPILCLQLFMFYVCSISPLQTNYSIGFGFSVLEIGQTLFVRCWSHFLKIFNRFLGLVCLLIYSWSLLITVESALHCSIFNLFQLIHWYILNCYGTVSSICNSVLFSKFLGHQNSPLELKIKSWPSLKILNEIQPIWWLNNILQ